MHPSGSKPRSNKDTIAQALDEHRGRLRRFVSGRVPASSVDDALQTAALRAVERADSLQQPDRVSSWLFKIHRSVIADVLRGTARRARLMELAQSTAPTFNDPIESEPAASCDCSLVQAQRLGASYTEMLNLVDIGEASLDEAASTLGISANNAAVRLHRARKALKTKILEHCGVQSAAGCSECRCVADGCCTA